MVLQLISDSINNKTFIYILYSVFGVFRLSSFDLFLLDFSFLFSFMFLVDFSFEFLFLLFLVLHWLSVSLLSDLGDLWFEDFLSALILFRKESKGLLWPYGSSWLPYSVVHFLPPLLDDFLKLYHFYHFVSFLFTFFCYFFSRLLDLLSSFWSFVFFFDHFYSFSSLFLTYFTFLFLKYL